MALVRRPPKHGTWLLNSLIGLPLALSPVVVGLALILVYGRDGWLGGWLTENGIRSSSPRPASSSPRSS